MNSRERNRTSLATVFWAGVALLVILGLATPGSARAAFNERVCARAMEVNPNDLDARLMKWTPDGFWFVEQRMRLCQDEGGVCSNWSAPGKHLELAVQDKRGKRFYRYAFTTVAVKIKDEIRGRDRLLGAEMGRDHSGGEFEIGRIKRRALVRDYEYSIASQPGFPIEQFQISIWRIKKKGSLKFEVSDDFSQACIEI